MPEYFAFLRAINVGGHVVKMDTLRSLFEDSGASHVETFIASGNVFFSSLSTISSDLALEISNFLKQRLGYPVEVFIRTPAELLDIVSRQLFANPGSADIYIAFLTDHPSNDHLTRLVSYNSNENEFASAGREVYWLCRTRFSDSTFSGALMEKVLESPVTIRNISTLEKMVKKFNLRD